jgi:hypothetical protein
MVTIGGQKFKLIAMKPFVHGGEQRWELKLQKPNGTRFYFATRYADGSTSAVV